MKTKKLIAWILSCVPLIVTAFVLPVLPAQVPAHYGFDGTADRYGSKYEMLFLPVFTILFQLFWMMTDKIAAKNKEKEAQTTFKVTFWSNIACSLTFLALTIWFLSLSYSNAESLFDTGDFDFLRILAVILNVSFIFIGNFLPKCKQNLFVGIRTKWTLENDTVWYKTHRVGGAVVVIFGVVAAILCLTVLHGIAALSVTGGGLLAICVYLVIYSYAVYKKQETAET
ncbi:hemolysin expression modulating protein [Clostridia bacterium]|nr:hemolysin expression modulating protein [Clostridia bacterium]